MVEINKGDTRKGLEDTRSSEILKSTSIQIVRWETAVMKKNLFDVSETGQLSIL